MINQIKFNNCEKPTLGVELELFTADSEKYSLINGAPKILQPFQDDFFFKEELLQCIVEITTDVCNNTLEVYDDLRPKLDKFIIVSFTPGYNEREASFAILYSTIPDANIL